VKLFLNDKYDCKKTVKELDNLVRDASSLFNNSPTCGIDGSVNISKMGYLEEIILQHLLNKTNFYEILNSLKAGYGIIKSGTHTIIYSTLCNLRKAATELTFYNFLDELEKKLDETASKPLKTYTYYIPSKIFFRLTTEEIKTIQRKFYRFCNVKFNPPKDIIFKKIKNSDVRSFFGRLPTKSYIRIDVQARDTFFAEKIVGERISGLLGFFSFIENRGSNVTIYMPFDLGMAIDRPLISDKLFILTENQKQLLFPNETFSQFLGPEIKKFETMSLWYIHSDEPGNYKEILKYLDLINKNSKNILPLVYQSFELYYDACVEKNLEISFLKFWIITETILKQGKQRDKKFISTLEKLVKEKHFRTTIYNLYRKRNELVHEFETDYISQNDRNLTKYLAEIAISFLINPPKKINNLEEIKIMADNITSSEEELKIKIKILKSILNKK
jgi:hypothetical protein